GVVLQRLPPVGLIGAGILLLLRVSSEIPAQQRDSLVLLTELSSRHRLEVHEVSARIEALARLGPPDHRSRTIRQIRPDESDSGKHHSLSLRDLRLGLLVRCEIRVV